MYNHKRIEVSSGHDRLVSLVSAEDTLALQQRLQLLDRLWDEVTEQIGARRRQIDSRIEQWSDFDDRCNRLTAAIAKIETAVTGSSELPIEDLIVLLKTVSPLCFTFELARGASSSDHLTE